MNIHVHVSYPENLGTNDSKRVWMIPTPFRQKCIEILGGDISKPSSIALRKGYLTQSQTTAPISKILTSLGRKFLEVPAGENIKYRNALICGYEYIFSQIYGAWSFDSVSDILLNGYTEERICPNSGNVQSIGPLRQTIQQQSDGGIRYLIKYAAEKKKYIDIYKILEFERHPEEAREKCEASDELAEMIF